MVAILLHRYVHEIFGKFLNFPFCLNLDFKTASPLFIQNKWSKYVVTICTILAFFFV